jgi:hypothetical protein
MQFDFHVLKNVAIYFNVFPCHWLADNIDSLARKGNVVLTERQASRYLPLGLLPITKEITFKCSEMIFLYPHHRKYT